MGNQDCEMEQEQAGGTGEESREFSEKGSKLPESHKIEHLAITSLGISSAVKGTQASDRGFPVSS